jgi:putative peptidoglycan lipid II flippase
MTRRGRKAVQAAKAAPADASRVGRYTAIFASGTLLSRVLGLARDVTLARLAPGLSLDAFLVAFRLPNMLRDLIGEGAMNAAFVPVFTSRREQESEESFRQLVRSSLTVMLLLLAALTTLGVWLAPQLLQLMESLRPVTGRTPTEEELELVQTMARWTFPYLFFIGLAVFMMAPLFTLGRYGTPSWSPALLNVSLIACALLGYVWKPELFGKPVYALVLGVWLGGIAQLVVQYIALGRASGIWLPGIRLHPGLREIFVLMGPVALGQAAGEVNKLVDALFAYSLPTGAVTALFYANRLIQLPLSIFGMATAAAVLPAISTAAARGDVKEAAVRLRHGFSQTAFLVLPAALGLIVLGRPVVRLLFEGGEFGPADAARTTTAMAILAVGLLAFALVKVAVTGFYGMKDTKTPVVVSSCCMLLNIVLNVLFVKPLGYQGLALATTISFIVNFGGLYAFLGNRLERLWSGEMGFSLLRIAMAAVLANAAGFGIYVRLHYLFPSDAFVDEAVCALIPVAASAGLYFGLCALFRVPEAAVFLNLLKRKG